MTTTVKRDIRIDNMKGILMILVVLGHFITLSAFPGSKQLYLIIYTFHMPAFAFLSGFCSSSEFKPKKLAASLLYPYLVLQTIFALFQTITHHDLSQFQFFQPIYLSWYMLSTFFWKVSIPFIHTEKRSTALIIFICSVLIAVMCGFDSSIDEHLSLSRTLCFAPFFIGGYYIKQFAGALPKESMKQRIFFTVLGLIGTGLLIHFRAAIQPEWLWQELPYVSFGYSIPFWLRLSLDVLAVIYIAVMLFVVPNRELPFLTKLGRNTIGVYALHGLFARGLAPVLLKISFISTNWMIFSVLFSLITIVICMSAPVMRFAHYLLTFPGQWYLLKEENNKA